MHRLSPIKVLFALVLAGLAALGVLWWKCLHDPGIAFLPPRPGADWIVYPSPPAAGIQSCTPLEARFRCSFNLDALPPRAVVTVCALKEFSVMVNGQAAENIIHAGKYWKSGSTLDITKLLHAGANEIMVCVTNSQGPPALWLHCQPVAAGILPAVEPVASSAAEQPHDGDKDVQKTNIATGRTITPGGLKHALSVSPGGPTLPGQMPFGTDKTWMVSQAGSPWQYAVAATDPSSIAPGNPFYGQEKLFASVIRAWPLLLLFCAASIISVIVVDLWMRRHPNADHTKLVFALLVVVIVARIALFINDVPQLSRIMGFDAPGHENYVKFIQEHDALPSATDGWEMYQPPLYYLCGAGLLDTCALSTGEDDATLVLRSINGLAGALLCVLSLLCLRLLFPKNAGAQAVGLLVAALIPPQLYLSLYVTNELLAALFATATFYFLLRILQVHEPILSPEVPGHQPPTPPLPAGRAVALRRRTGEGRGLSRHSDATAGVGESSERNPHPVRGKSSVLPDLLTPDEPILSPEVPGPQPPTPPLPVGEGRGEGESSDHNALPSQGKQEKTTLYIGLGASLGAALLTKSSSLLLLPFILLILWLHFHWHHRAFRNGLRFTGIFLLSCVIICGAYYGKIWWQYGELVKGNWESFWQYPGFATYAYYCRFGHVFVAPLFSGLWSFGDGIYSTLWGDGLLSGQATPIGRPPWNYHLMDSGYVLSAMLSLIFLIGFGSAIFRFIRQRSLAWLLMTGTLVLFGSAIFYLTLRVPFDSSVKAFYGLPALVPFSAVTAAGWDWLTRKQCRAREQAARFLSVILLLWSLTVFASFWVRPRNPQTWLDRGIGRLLAHNDEESARCFSMAAQLEETSNHAGDDPAFVQIDGEARFRLGLLCQRHGDVGGAVENYQKAVAANPDYPEPLNNLAWILATSSNPAIRNGSRAVQLAEHACELTQYRETTLIATLAAAYAGAGRFDDAVATARRAIVSGQGQGETNLVQINQNLLKLYLAHQPCRAGK